MATPTADIPRRLRQLLSAAFTSTQAGKYFRRLFNTLLGSTTTYPVAAATFSVGAESSNVITVAVQLVDGMGDDVTERHVVRAYLSSDTAGDAVASDPGSWAAGTDGTLISEELDDLVGTWRSEADGDIDVAVTSTGTSTFYLNVILPNGKTARSGAITFA